MHLTNTPRLRNITHHGITAKIEDLDEIEKVIKKDNLNFYLFAKIKCFQSDLTEAFAKLNQVPLTLLRSDKDNFLCICIQMTGTYFIL
jgi:hypothetical protein